MEPLVSDKEPSTPEKSICEQQAPFQQQIVSSVVASLINEVTETGEMENMEKFKENQTKVMLPRRVLRHLFLVDQRSSRARSLQPETTLVHRQHSFSRN